MHNINHRGFTLIELLIVIAIIGILASVMIPRMNIVRDKAVDANIKSGMSTLVESAEIFADNNNTYDGFCASDSASTTLVAATVRSTTTIPGYSCYDDVNGFAASVPMKELNQINDTSGVDYWCLETGKEGQKYDTDLATDDITCS